MARRKVVEKKQNEDVLLTKQEVWDVLEFSRQLSGYFPGILTPDLINARMKEISYTPTAASQDTLNRALQNPKDSENDLRSFIENFEIVSMPLKRIFSYLTSHLSMDLTYSVINAEATDYGSKKFIKDQNIVYDYFDHFDYKSFFRNATKQLLRNEMFVASVREDGEKVVLQELPIQYCRLTARWDYGLLASFNFYYFLIPGVDIDLYHPFFKKKFNQVMQGGRLTSYDPSLSPSARGNSQYVYWVDLPPEVGWVFKLDTSLVTAVPYFTGLMPDLINQDLMRTLQKDLNMASASKILIGQVPLLKENKGANVKDMISIDPVTLGKFLNLVKSSLSSAIKVTSAPLEDMKSISFDGNDEMYDHWLRTALSSSGMNTALIYSSMVKANLVDSQLSFESDSKIMEQQLYPQFNSFLNYFVNKRTKYFKYDHELEGNDYYLNRGQRFDKQIELLGQGIVLPQKIAAALGIKPQTLYRWMQESKAMGFTTDLMTPIIPAFQQSGAAGGGGRPKKSEDTLGDSGEQTRSSGGNLPRGGKN
jgi:hypothetical protein